MEADMRPRSGGEPPKPASSLRLTPQIAFGALVVVAGLALLGDNLNLIEADRVFELWPLGLVVVGVFKLLSPTQGRSGRVFGGLITFIGVALSAERIFPQLPIDFDDWWPLVLIGFGALILTRGLGRGRADAGTPASRDAYFSEFATWAGKQRRVATDAFRGADLTAVMGGIEIDLRGAGTSGGHAVIDVFVMWGGIEIWVPPDWAVSNEVRVLMGGVEDKSAGTQGATNQLTVRGVVIMGGLEIKT